MMAEGNIQMFEDQVLNAFIENAVKKAKDNIEEKGKIETEDAIPLMLKSQMNHIHHLESHVNRLEKETANKKDLKNLEEKFFIRFNALEKSFDFAKWLIMFGFAFLATLQIFLAIVK
ncbi:hypothetical protein ACFL56_01355 [Candidatus Margulisiibacteriota bacterium]